MIRACFFCIFAYVVGSLACLRIAAAQTQEIDIPASQWHGRTSAEVAALPKRCAVAVAYPPKQAEALTVVGPASLPPGLYEVQLTVRPSHVAGDVAFHSRLRVKSAGEVLATFPGEHFARAHEPETRSLQFVHPAAGPLRLEIEALADAEACQRTFVASQLKAGAVKMRDPLATEGHEEGLVDSADAALSTDRAVYYVLDQVRLATISRSGRVASVQTDKIRYRPGETLHGSVVVEDVGGHGGQGTVNVYLEYHIHQRVKVQSLPVKLLAASQTLALEVRLPDKELGYALVAEFTSAGGSDRNEAAEYFTIAENFFRVAVFGGAGTGHGGTKADEATMRQWANRTKAAYVNACESFAWAEEDMVAMSPADDYWFSGQTCYHLCKEGLQRRIRLGHEKGIAAVTYGKFVMSGYLGWKTAYEYPSDHKGQYQYPVGMWEGVDVGVLDRFRNKEFAIYERGPEIAGSRFEAFWQSFLPINPDNTPRMVRIAAEEVVRSIDMFGWDAVRWDGHPRGGGSCGGSDEPFDPAAARRTQTLVRYFKDIVAAKHPDFRHGYNYLFIQPKPKYDWAYEDYELDELCRGGGLLMNESIGNATRGPFGFLKANLQVEGDLCRERGGYFLSISGVGGTTPRDTLVEAALWAAGGARTYGCPFPEQGRYYTRFAQYVLDERLRRLATPEKVLQPERPTRLDWKPFVYESPLEDGQRRLIVNFLNLPLEENRAPINGPPRYAMLPGTDPVGFRLTLPEGLHARAVHLLEPWTLRVTDLPLAGDRFEVPSVAAWLVAVIDVAVDAAAPSLAEQYGPPKTFGVPRSNFQGDRPKQLVLDVGRESWEVNKDMSGLAGPPRPDGMGDQAALDALPLAQRNVRLLKIRESNPPASLLKTWWKGGALPADLALEGRKLAFGNLAPRRNGRFDIFHARGAMDYSLRLPEVFAGLERFHIHDAPLFGSLRQSPDYHLADGANWRRYPEFDLLLFTAIPHGAIGAENCYALVQYVKAGGAALFTGGEYAFGKGGYLHTVLDRQLLPVQCVEMVDTRTSETPLAIEPGPDFADLHVSADFGVKPSFWVWNQVAVKNEPGVKVFLKSGNRPVLVGWTLGEGRVACLLVDHRGKSQPGATAFFDWADWPRLVRAVLVWLAPEAGKTVAPAAPPAAELARLLSSLEADAMDDLPLDGLGGPGLGNDVVKPRKKIAPPAGGGKGPSPADAATEAIVRRALDVGGPEMAAALVRLAVADAALSQDLREAIVDLVRQHPPGDLATTARQALTARDPTVQACGYSLLALAGDAEFRRAMLGPVPALEADPVGRRLALAFGVAVYPRPDLDEEGRSRVAAWNAAEDEAKRKYTGGREFSPAAPDVPCLDPESIFQRAAWLAYLARHDAKTHGAEFAKQWLMTAQCQDYCDRSIAGLWSGRNMTAVQQRTAKIKTEDWQRMKRAFARLQTWMQPGLQSLAREHGQQLAEGFRRAHFTWEYRAALNFLGRIDAASARAILPDLVTAGNVDLRTFAAARLAAMGEP